MVNKFRQLRLTVPKWIADLKEWNQETHLEFVPLIRDNDSPITNDTTFIIKEVKK